MNQKVLLRLLVCFSTNSRCSPAACDSYQSHLQSGIRLFLPRAAGSQHLGGGRIVEAAAGLAVRRLHAGRGWIAIEGRVDGAK